MKTCFYTPFAECKSWKEMIDASVECGLDCLEMFTSLELSEPDLETAKQLRAYADGKGISICCLSCFIDLTGDDREKQIQRAKGFTEVAAILGSAYFHHTICPDFLHPEAVECCREELFEKGVLAVREIYDHGQTVGVRTVYEDQAFIFNGVEGFGRFLDAVDRPVGVVADFGNIRQKDEEVLNFIRRFFPRIVHAHLKDSVLHPAGSPQPKGGYPTQSWKWIEEVVPGSGTVPNGEGIALLKELGYDGICSIEWNTPDKALRKQVVDTVRGWMN